MNVQVLIDALVQHIIEYLLCILNIIHAKLSESF